MCFMAFGNHDFLDSKKKHCIRNYSKVKGEIFRAENLQNLVLQCMTLLTGIYSGKK